MGAVVQSFEMVPLAFTKYDPDCRFSICREPIATMMYDVSSAAVEVVCDENPMADASRYCPVTVVISIELRTVLTLSCWTTDVVDVSGSSDVDDDDDDLDAA